MLLAKNVDKVFLDCCAAVGTVGSGSRAGQLSIHIHSSTQHEIHKTLPPATLSQAPLVRIHKEQRKPGLELSGRELGWYKSESFRVMHVISFILSIDF